tara:strand:- start:803 stop:1027 length:225 start_codon:yes stop_codon:yes gene_type:complete
MSLKDAVIIEKSRPLASNEFVFYKRVVIDDGDIWALFDYITKISNITIIEIDTDNFIPRSNNFNAPVAIRINKK